MNIINSTQRYTLKRDRFGHYLLIKRDPVTLADGASRYFQGEDAEIWEHNIESIMRLEREGGWRAGNSLDKSFDFLCSGYDDVLHTARAVS